ncbi:tetratricopeptide repeat protein [Nemorincola caseinilytica]|uniref:Tetratricopeptide repeat protein n=1 Tax=Nemorincola caseinilytica TaxID=2054315 RepID=A0ABP8NE88_9BACT
MAAATAPGKDLFSIRNLCIILGLVSFAVYFNTIWNGFVMDDVMVLKENRMVLKGASAIPELLTTPHMRGYLIIPNDLYRPLSLVMFALEYSLFGLSPAMHHLFNILTFAGCSIMLFIFLHKFFDGKRVALAFISALIFAVHPVHTEVVANIKSRDELMCFFFAFWSLNVYMNYMRDGKILQLLLGAFLFYLSIISKETVIAFVGVIPVLFFIYKNDDKKRAMLITAATLVAFGIFMGVRSSVLNAYDANNPAANVEFIDNALSGAPDMPLTAVQVFTTKMVVMGHYLKLMFLPYPLVSTYSYNAIPFADLADIRFWASLLVYGALIYFMVTRFIKDRKDPWAFAIMLYLATIFLFSNFPFLMGAELAERFAFFASAGTCLLIGLAIERWIIKGIANDVSQLKTGKVLAILAPLCLLYGGWAAARNAEWKDNVTLYKADVQRAPNDCRLYHNVGSALAEEEYEKEPDSLKKRAIDDEAIGYLRKGAEIYPGYADLYVEIGRIYDRQKRYDSAIKYNSMALKMNPTNFTANNNMGSALLTAGRYRDAIPYFQLALQYNPTFKYAYLNMARCYQQLQRFDSSLINFRHMLEFEPQNIDLYTEIGTAHFMMQNYDSANYYYQLVMKQKPEDPNIVNNIGAVLLNQKKYAEAIPYFQKAVAMSPGYFNAYTNLARSYYFAGQYQAAIETINKEIQIDQQQSIKDIPYIALSYQKLGNMAEAKRYEAISRQYWSNFKLE